MEKENQLSLERIKRKLTLIGNDFSRFSDYMTSRDYKGDREGIPHIHPIP